MVLCELKLKLQQYSVTRHLILVLKKHLLLSILKNVLLLNIFVKTMILFIHDSLTEIE